MARPSRGRDAWGPVYFLRLAGGALATRGGELRPTGIVGGSLRRLGYRRPSRLGGANAGRFITTRVFAPL